MQRVKLDAIDRKILEQLRDDGRMTNVELARRVGISAPPCLRRVRALEEAGFIRGYHAELNQELLGYGLTVFAWVGLHSQAEHDLEAFEALVGGWPMVRECHMLTGEADFILKCVARSWDAWQRFLTHELTPAPNVASVKTAPVLRRSKSLPGVPLDAAVEPAER
jgi:DNA-binding Lrp family transcriptional regulator